MQRLIHVRKNQGGNTMATSDHIIMWDTIRSVIRQNATELLPDMLGNVEFWYDGDDFCYDPATYRWDLEEVHREIQRRLSKD